MPIQQRDITIENFCEIFGRLATEKEAAGVTAVQRNPDDLLARAKPYGIHYRNGSWGWGSNIWSRSAQESVVVGSEDKLKDEHRQLMLSVLEFMLCRPMIQVDANLGSPGSLAEMRCRLFCDPQFPDIPYRWQKLNFPGDADATPEATLFMVPQFLENPRRSDNGHMLRVLRFPNHGYSIITASSYQGEAKKGFLSHWIRHAYLRGGTGEHASLKEFTVKRAGGGHKRIVMACWGLTGSGKSTHGMYIVNDLTAPRFVEQFGVDPREFISDQAIKNDDIVAVFEDQVVSPELGAWTKTEGVDPYQVGIYRAAYSPQALHENTEWNADGDVSFAGELFQYKGTLNCNARSVLMLEDTGYFDGSVDSSEPLNFAVFISPAYLNDYAWVKLADPLFAAKVLADGRTVGHPAQSLKGVGEAKFVARYCLPFTMGVSNTAHVHRFHQFMTARQGTDNPIETFQINTTGRVGAEYDWVEEEVYGQKMQVPKTRFAEVNHKRKPVGGAGPSIEETELFLFQAARGAVEYEPHPLYGDKVLAPVKVPGITAARLKEFNPFTYRSLDEMKRLLRVQNEMSKLFLAAQSPGLDDHILSAMDI